MRTVTKVVCVVFGMLCLFGASESAASSAAPSGGLIVKIGLKDAGDSLVTLRNSEQLLVCGLDSNVVNVAAARSALESQGLVGPITVAEFDGSRLPFAENMVNQLIADDLDALSMDEVMRVLVPDGSAIVGTNTTVKPWPVEMDEWTHYLHGPDNNAVSKDSMAGHPTSVQWIGGPKFSRMHESLRRTTSMVTARGRLFSIVDEGNDQDISMPPVWRLIGRDAFNGIVLWKRDLLNWAAWQRYFRSGPVDLAHRLVAVDDKVYVTLGLDQPVSILDARTGKTLTTVQGSEHASQILCDGSELIIITDPNIYHGDNRKLFKHRGTDDGKVLPQKIMLADAETGAVKWAEEFNKHIFTTVSLGKDKVAFQTAEGVSCLDRTSGKQLWSTPAPFVPEYRESGGHETHTMVIWNDLAVARGSKKTYAISLDDGRILWSGESHPGYNSAPDLFVFDDIDGKSGVVGPGGHYFDIMTGEEVTRQMGRGTGVSPSLTHHRCYRKKATEKYLLSSRSGVELTSLDKENWGEIWLHHWIRGECQYGIMPANGMLYIPTDPCACNMQTKLNGNWALTPRKPAEPWKMERLVKGPAYGKTTAAKPAPWPTYRANNERSASTAAFPGTSVSTKWTLPLESRKLSGITIGTEYLFVAAIDQHRVYAIDRRSGGVAWTYTAGGRIDSPPTIYKGLAIFGCADGQVYALRESDGKLAWRFMAAPEDRRMFSFGQLESVWPVHGSVLIEGDTLIVSAGRQTYIDGGIYVYKMNPATGVVKSRTVLNSIDPATGKQPDVSRELGGVNLQGTKNDVLSAVDGSVFMRHLKIDFDGEDFTGKGEHLFSEAGFLDDTQWYRIYWVYGSKFKSGYGSWNEVGGYSPSGRIMAFNDEFICGYGRNKYPGRKAGQWRANEKYRLFAMKKDDHTVIIPGDPNAKRRGKRKDRSKSKYIWEKEIPVMVRAMAMAGDRIIIAGLPDPKPKRNGRKFASEDITEQMTAVYSGEKGGVLAIHDAKTGEMITETKLDAEPVFDGMAVADGKIYLAMKNGKIVSYSCSQVLP